MAETVRQLSELKVKVERLRANTDRAKGALDVALAELRDKWGCVDLDDARSLLERLEKEGKVLKTTYTQQFDAFEKAHGELLAQASTK